MSPFPLNNHPRPGPVGFLGPQEEEGRAYEEEGPQEEECGCGIVREGRPALVGGKFWRVGLKSFVSPHSPNYQAAPKKKKAAPKKKKAPKKKVRKSRSAIVRNVCARVCVACHAD